jgi:hypothetical protein
VTLNGSGVTAVPSCLREEAGKKQLAQEAGSRVWLLTGIALTATLFGIVVGSN